MLSQWKQVETYAKALVGDELIEKIRDAHIIGIRSKTKLTKAVLDEAKNLIAIGCFCIGTNQVDLKCAADKGVSWKITRVCSDVCDNNSCGLIIDCCFQLSFQQLQISRRISHW